MSEHCNLTNYYDKIAEKLDEMVPVEWSKIVMYAEDFGHINSAVFYFYSKDNQIHYSRDIPEEYNIPKEIYECNLKELWNINHNMWIESITSQDHKWNSLTFSLYKNKRFKVKYGYHLDVKMEDFEREIRWVSNELGIMTREGFGKQIFDKYANQKNIKNYIYRTG